MKPFFAMALCIAGCRAEEPPTVDWCAVPLPVPVAPRVAPDAGLIYEIYVRAFQDTDGDGRGDLAGVTAHLDYLAEMGVGTVWLMPIFESPESAGYASSDWDAVDSDYGSEEDLETLVAAAADRGMRVLLDVPINHTSDEHPWFQAALNDPESNSTSDYLFSHHQWDEERWYPTGDGRYYYAYFGAAYPDLDLTRVEVAEALAQTLNGWLDAGVGGFRVDAVVQLIEEGDDVGDTAGSHCLMAWLTQKLHAEHPDALVMSEAWSRNADQNLAWLGEDEAPESDLVLDVPRRAAVLEAWLTGDPGLLTTTLRTQLDADRSDRTVPYLSTHDVARLSVELPDTRWRRGAMVFQLLGPGMPMLYYGDELDLPSAPEADQDEPQRAPMLWDDTYNAGFTEGIPWYSIDQRYLDGYNAAAEAEDPDSMLSLVLALADLRAASTAVQAGETTLIASGSPSLFAMQRTQDAEGVVVLVNFSDALLTGIWLPLPPELGPWTDLSTGSPLATTIDGVALPDLIPYGYTVLGTAGLAGVSIPGPVVYDAEALRTP